MAACLLGFAAQASPVAQPCEKSDKASVAVAAMPALKSQMSLDEAIADSTIQGCLSLLPHCNDTFHANSLDPVTYFKGAVVCAPATFDSGRSSGRAGAPGAAPPNPFGTPSRPNFTQPQSANGKITGASDNGRILPSPGDPVHSWFLTSATSLPFSANPLDPALGGASLPDLIQSLLITSYSRRFRRFTWSTRLDVRKLFNDGVFFSDPASVWAPVASLRDNPYQQPRCFYWTNKFSF
jgi:hypothetical protein